MKYYVEKSFADFEPWSDAVATFDRIIKADKADEAEAYLEEIAPTEGWSETAINDYLWHAGDYLLEALGITDEEEADEEEEIND